MPILSEVVIVPILAEDVCPDIGRGPGIESSGHGLRPGRILHGADVCQASTLGSPDFEDLEIDSGAFALVALHQIDEFLLTPGVALERLQVVAKPIDGVVRIAVIEFPRDCARLLHELSMPS